MEVAIIGGMMVIVLPVNNPIVKSKSGKTLVVASSRGNRRTSARIGEKPVIVNANAYIRPDTLAKYISTSKRKASRKGPSKKQKAMRNSNP